VKVVSGGGSGHEPAFFGLLGPGSLDGVAVGNVFAAPAAADAVRTIELLGTGEGVLLVYGNYQGDRLNFGLAASQLRRRGLAVETVLVTDDVASAPPDRADERRGVAGSVFVFRLAAAAADAGYPLPEVARIATEAVEATRSVGVAMGGPRLPTSDAPSFTVEPGTIEVGMGVHGEAGLTTVASESVASLARRLVALLVSDGLSQSLDGLDGGAIGGNTPCHLLVNLAGATPLMEGYILAAEAVLALESSGARVGRVLVGPYLTTLDMAGASISVLTPTAEMLTLLRRSGTCIAGVHLPSADA
jgi:dihydroxyacetone kinase-like protein